MIKNKKIKLLNLTYDVEEVEEFGDNIILGQIVYAKQKILIRSDLSEERKKVTLLHEILHGILEQLGFNEECNNEHLINSLATAVYQVLNDNKSIFS